MTHSADRKLIFRLGETGFLLDLHRLVEICEQIADNFDPAHADLELGIVGALNFRQTQIPVVDPTLRFAIKSKQALVEKRALVLKGNEGNWALLVDQVEEISSVDKFQPCEIPLLLKKSVIEDYSQISLRLNEPMIHFDPDRFYGSALASR